jgi:RNA-binding protein 5/10
LLEILSQYAQVKDLRMISDKISGEPKDFAFVEYFTIEEATRAMNQIKRNPIKIKNNQIYVTFSKIRRPEDIKVKQNLR